MDEEYGSDEFLEAGNRSEDVYSDEGREDLVENGEISAIEQGFMEGAEMDGQQAKCASCGHLLTPGNTIEKQIEGDTKWFCSDHCAEKFIKEHEE